MAESIKLFLPNREAKYFCEQGWTENPKNCPSGKSPGFCSGTGNGEVDRSTLFHARSDDVVPLAVKLFALDLQFSQFFL
jgi:hypothetical protein